MRRIISIILFCIIPSALTAQGSSEPAWKIYYDSAQFYWGRDWQQTIPLLVRAERSAFNDLGIYDTNYLTIVNDLGLAYAKIRDYTNAEKLLGKCLALKTELSPSPDEGVFQSMLNLAVVHAEQEHFQQAEQLYKTILSAANVNTYKDIYWSTVQKLVLLYEHEDMLDTAMQLLDNLRPASISDTQNASEKYAVDLARGRVKRKLRKYEESGTILQTLVSELQNKKDQTLNTLYLQSLQETGLLYSETGSFSNAEKTFLQVFSLVERSQPIDNVLRIEVLNNLASLYERLGIYDKAIAYFQEALDLNGQLSEQNALATVTLQSNIAGIHLKQDDIQKAIGNYEAILHKLESLVPESSPFYITVLNNLATAYRKDNQYSEATVTLEKAYQLVQHYKLDSEDLASIVMNNMAVLLTAKGEPDEAILYYEKAYNVKRMLYGDNSVLLTDLAGNMAVVYWALRRPSQAIPLFQKSIELSIRQIKYIFPNLSEAEQIQFYKRLKEDFERFGSVAFQASSENPELLTQVFNNQITIKSLLFFTQQHRRNLILEKHDSVLINQYELLKTKREQLGYLYQLSLKDLARAENTAADLEQEINAIEKSISLQTSETVAEKITKNDAHWDDLKIKMRSDEALIEIIRFRKYDLKTYVQENTERVSFGFTDSIYYAALITTQETNLNPQLVLLNEGTNMETRFLSYYRNSLYFDLPDVNSYEQYWKPFESAIENKSRVYFSGDGVYHRINLNTLRKPGSGQFLLQQFDIHYLLNPAQFLERQSTSFTTKKAVLVGDPAFGLPYSGQAESRAGEQQEFAPLPGTNIEIVKISELLQSKAWNTHIFLKSLATEENLKSVNSPDILHIATHGFFSSDKVKLNAGAKKDFLFYSGLVLAGANGNLKNDVPESYEDGILTAYEVMNLDLTNTHLVVLSACETGLGKIENGEGVYGLQRAFLQAGARNIVISLWKVDDNITKNLMVRFYQYLFEQKSERDALKLAQIDLMKMSGNPRAWGGFIIIGLD